jgi:hypothetical protein
LVALFVGCSKVTSENYEKIQTGMTLAQVEQILGKGNERSGGGITIGDVGASAKVVKWGSDDKSITATFTNDKLVMKAQKGL